MFMKISFFRVLFYNFIRRRSTSISLKKIDPNQSTNIIPQPSRHHICIINQMSNNWSGTHRFDKVKDSQWTHLTEEKKFNYKITRYYRFLIKGEIFGWLTCYFIVDWLLVTEHFQSIPIKHFIKSHLIKISIFIDISELS